MSHSVSLRFKTSCNATALLLLIMLLGGCKKKDACADVVLPQLGTCTAVTASGQLTQTGNTYTFRTSAGGTIIMDSVSIRIHHDDYPTFKYELWGGIDDSVNNDVQWTYVHENLNGKHIKNKIGRNRTIVFPDGAKITLTALSDTTEVLTISIYDGADSYRINAACNKTLEHSRTDQCITQALDNAEADGEASTFEFTSTGLMFFNHYTEDTPGNKVYNRQNLGELKIALPNNVTDYFDDPRLGHT